MAGDEENIMAKYLKKISKESTLSIQFSSCHRHLHDDDVMIIMLYVSSTNSTTKFPLESFALHALFQELLHG